MNKEQELLLKAQLVEKLGLFEFMSMVSGEVPEEEVAEFVEEELFPLIKAAIEGKVFELKPE
jgi:hypothetical protein